jgi:hypothetical protein
MMIMPFLDWFEEHMKKDKEKVGDHIIDSNNLQQASNLVYVLSSQLQKSMDYYVSARSGISPFSSWSNTEKWAKYTSMIAGIYLIRKSLVSYVNKLTEKLVNTL